MFKHNYISSSHRSNNLCFYNAQGRVRLLQSRRHLHHESFSWLPTIPILATSGPESSRRRRVAGAQQKKKIAEGIPFGWGVGTWNHVGDFFGKSICPAYTDTVIPKESRANASWSDSQQNFPFCHPRISFKYWPPCPCFGQFACIFFQYLSYPILVPGM